MIGTNPYSFLVDAQNPINWMDGHTSSLLSVWKGVHGNDGSSTLYDLLQKHNGTLSTSGGFPQWVASPLVPMTSALTFDAGGGYVDCGEGSGDFDANITEMTIVVDVMPLVVSGFPGIVGKGNSDSSTSGSYLLYVSSSGSKYGWIVYSGSTRQVNLFAANTSVKYGTWQQVAVTWKASSVAKIYVDGVLHTTSGATSASIDNTTYKLLIGSNEGNSSNLGKYPWGGMIDSVRFYTRAWSDAEILSLFYRSRSIDTNMGILHRPSLAHVGLFNPIPTSGFGRRLGFARNRRVVRL